MFLKTTGASTALLSKFHRLLKISFLKFILRYKDPESSKLQYFGINKKGRPIRGSKGRKFKKRLQYTSPNRLSFNHLQWYQYYSLVNFEKPTCHFLPRPIEKVLMAEPQLCDLALIETEIIESIKNSQKDSFKACFDFFERLYETFNMQHMVCSIISPKVETSLEWVFLRVFDAFDNFGFDQS